MTITVSIHSNKMLFSSVVILILVAVAKAQGKYKYRLLLLVPSSLLPIGVEVLYF